VVCLNWLKAYLAMKREFTMYKMVFVMHHSKALDAVMSHAVLQSIVFACKGVMQCNNFESMSNHKCKMLLGRTGSTLA